jgi:hypothetical protein
MNNIVEEANDVIHDEEKKSSHESVALAREYQ